MGHIFGGDEVLFAWNSATGALMSKGKGLIGDGDDDAFEEGWATVKLQSDNVVKSINGTTHFFVRLSTGEVFTFGDNYFGQLGKGDEENTATPTELQVGEAATILDVQAG